MAGKHGKRCYYQVLLQPHRAALIEAIAEERSTPEKKVRSTQVIREFIYQSLEREIPQWEYDSAVEADNEVWNQAVKNRVAGRAASRKRNQERMDELMKHAAEQVSKDVPE